MESSHVKEIKDNNLLSKCFDQAKSYLTVKEKSYKDAVLRGGGRNRAKPLETTRRNVREPVDTESPVSIAQNVVPRMPLPTISDAEKEWKIKFDVKRKKNVIVYGIYDANSQVEDLSFLKQMFRDTGCRGNFSQISHLARLGPKKFNRDRLLMICFDTEEAATKVLNKCKNLSSSRTYGRINVKSDLPRDQRQVSSRSENSLNQAAMGSQPQRQRGERYTVLPTTNNNIDIDDNILTSDESDDDRESSDSDISPDGTSTSGWTTIDDTEWVSGENNNNRNSIEGNITSSLSTSTADISPEAIASLLASQRTPGGLEAAINIVGLTPKEATNTEGEIVVDEIRAEIHKEEEDENIILSGDGNSKRGIEVKSENSPSGNGETMRRRGED